MSQIAEKKFLCAMLLGGLSVNLNHLKKKPLDLFSLYHGHREYYTFPEQEKHFKWFLQGSHISGLTKFHDISRFFKKIPGIFSEYFNVASNYFWINVYIKVSPEQNISFPQYPIVTPPLTATPQAKHMSG